MPNQKFREEIAYVNAVLIVNANQYVFLPALEDYGNGVDQRKKIPLNLLRQQELKEIIKLLLEQRHRNEMPLNPISVIIGL